MGEVDVTSVVLFPFLLFCLSAIQEAILTLVFKSFGFYPLNFKFNCDFFVPLYGKGRKHSFNITEVYVLMFFVLPVEGVKNIPESYARKCCRFPPVEKRHRKLNFVLAKEQKRF